MRGAMVGWLVVLMVAPSSSEVARAQQVPQLPPPPAPPSSVAVLAAHLVAGLYAAPLDEGARLELLVGGSAVTRPEAGAFVADAIEAALRVRQPVFSRHVPRAGETAGASGPTERVELVLAVRDGHLMATARRRLLPRTIWEALADREGRIVATAYANVALDLELRTVFSIGKREVRIDRARSFQVSQKSTSNLTSGRILDCYIGDLDGDRVPELVALSPLAVSATRWADGGFSVELSTWSLEALAAPEARLREPLGRVVPVVRPDGTSVLVVASSERGEPVVLAFEGGALTRSPLSFQRGWPLHSTGIDSFLIAPWPRAIDTLEGGVTEARFGTAAAQWIGSLSRVHELRGEHVARFPAQTAALAGGGLYVTLSGASMTAPGVGVSAIVTDLDADGTPELVTTSMALEGPDRLTLSALNAATRAGGGGATRGLTRGLTRGQRPLWTGAVPQPVSAMCAGDVDRDGFEEIVVATWNGRAADLHLVVPR